MATSNSTAADGVRRLPTLAAIAAVLVGLALALASIAGRGPILAVSTDSAQVDVATAVGVIDAPVGGAARVPAAMSALVLVAGDSPLVPIGRAAAPSGPPAPLAGNGDRPLAPIGSGPAEAAGATPAAEATSSPPGGADSAAAPLDPARSVAAPTDATTGASFKMWRAAATPLEAAQWKPLPFQEAHWQGIEAIPSSPALLKVLGQPADARGVIVDEVTAPADWQGFAAGDLITTVGGVPTPSLEEFVAAAERVRDEGRVDLGLLRRSEPKQVTLWAKRLGTANGESAPMILPGAVRPHAYYGPCTDCHRIGTGGSLVADAGEMLAKSAPPIAAGAKAPHENRGPCSACHTTR